MELVTLKKGGYFQHIVSDYQPRVFGRYTLVDRIAKGGMAEIFLAHTRGFSGFEKTVVVKRLHPHLSDDPRFVEMLVDEAKITVQLQHVNIAQILDLGTVDGHYYIAMEWVDGRDLFAVLRELHDRQLHLPIEAAAYIAMQICHGLQYAHTYTHRLTNEPLDVVHRDISPQNILLSWSGEVKITDFGIVKARQRMTHTEAGVIKGKFYYMSPEHACGKEVDYRSDLFSIGIVLWEALTATPLYDDVDEAALMKRVQIAQVSSPKQLRADVPPELEMICMRALEVDPNTRWQSAEDMGRALATFLQKRSHPFTKLDLSTCLKTLFQQASPQASPLSVSTMTPTSSATLAQPADKPTPSEAGSPLQTDSAPETTRPLRPVAAALPIESHAEVSLQPRASEQPANKHDPLAQTRRLSLDDILAASSLVAANPIGASSSMSAAVPSPAIPPTGSHTDDRLDQHLKVALAAAIVIDVILALCVVWLILNPKPEPTMDERSSAPVTITHSAPLTTKLQTKAQPVAEALPKTSDLQQSPTDAVANNSDAQIKLIRPAGSDGLRLYLNGELRLFKGDKVTVPAGRYSVKARLLPSGKLTDEQIINLAPGKVQSVRF